MLLEHSELISSEHTTEATAIAGWLLLPSRHWYCTCVRGVSALSSDGFKTLVNARPTAGAQHTCVDTVSKEERPGDDQNHTAYSSHLIAAQICRHSFAQSVKVRLNVC